MASRYGHTEAVQLLMHQGANPNLPRRTDGAFPLYAAAVHMHVECVRALLRGECAPNQTRVDGSTALHGACSVGSLPVVKMLLHKKGVVNVNAIRKCDGAYPIHCAARYRFHEIIGFLLTKGAEIDAQMSDGQSALHIAAERKHSEVIRTLLHPNVGPSISVMLQDKRGWTALHVAVNIDAAKKVVRGVKGVKESIEEEDMHREQEDKDLDKYFVDDLYEKRREEEKKREIEEARLQAMEDKATSCILQLLEVSGEAMAVQVCERRGENI